jgi:hypothetical protein
VTHCASARAHTHTSITTSAIAHTRCVRRSDDISRDRCRRRISHQATQELYINISRTHTHTHQCERGLSYVGGDDAPTRARLYGCECARLCAHTHQITRVCVRRSHLRTDGHVGVQRHCIDVSAIGDHTTPHSTSQHYARVSRQRCQQRARRQALVVVVDRHCAHVCVLVSISHLLHVEPLSTFTRHNRTCAHDRRSSRTCRRLRSVSRHVDSARDRGNRSRNCLLHHRNHNQPKPAAPPAYLTTRSTSLAPVRNTSTTPDGSVV